MQWKCKSCPVLCGKRAQLLKHERKELSRLLACIRNVCGHSSLSVFSVATYPAFSPNMRLSLKLSTLTWSFLPCHVNFFNPAVKLNPLLVCGAPTLEETPPFIVLIKTVSFTPACSTFSHNSRSKTALLPINEPQQPLVGQDRKFCSRSSVTLFHVSSSK